MSEKKASPEQGFYKVARATVAFICVLGCLSLAGMFVLGLMVGRNMSPVRFDIKDIQEDIARLREALLEKERQEQARQMAQMAQNSASDGLTFYSALSNQGTETALIAKYTSDTMPPPPPFPEEASPAAGPLTETAFAMAEAATGTYTTVVAEGAALTPAEKPVEEERHAVQIAACASQKNAMDAVAKYKGLGYSAYMSQLRSPGKPTLYRIRVGPYPSREAAKTALAKLRSQGADTILVEE
jgi:cell division septation protein DedD